MLAIVSIKGISPVHSLREVGSCRLQRQCSDRPREVLTGGDTFIYHRDVVSWKCKRELGPPGTWSELGMSLRRSNFDSQLAEIQPGKLKLRPVTPATQDARPVQSQVQGLHVLLSKLWVGYLEHLAEKWFKT